MMKAVGRNQVSSRVSNSSFSYGDFRRRTLSPRPFPSRSVVLLGLWCFCYFQSVNIITSEAAKVPFEVNTPAVIDCDDAKLKEEANGGGGIGIGCCPAASEAYVLPIGTEDYTEYRDYDDSFFCNAEICTIISEYSLNVMGPAKVVCPDRVTSDCRTAAALSAELSSADLSASTDVNGTNTNSTTTELTFYKGEALGDTLFIGGYDVDNTFTYIIDKAELVTCSNRCEVKATSQQYIGYVELDCGDDDDDLPFECVEDGTNSTLPRFGDNNNRIIVDYYQVVRCPTTKYCNVIDDTESKLLIGPAMVVDCDDECYLDRNVPANATTITTLASEGEDNSTTTTTTTITKVDYDEEMKCAHSCTVIYNSTEVIGPALITCNYDFISVEENDGQQEEEGEVTTIDETTTPLWGCMEEDEGNINNSTGGDGMTAEFGEFDNQKVFIDTSRRVRCDSRCDIQGSFVVYSPANIKCTGSTFGCYSDTKTWTTGGSTETTLEREEDERFEVEIMVRQVLDEVRCDATNCKVTKGDGIEVEGPAYVTCDSDTLGCEGVVVSSDLGDGSSGKTYYQYQLNMTGRCDPDCKVVHHRTINGPTEVWCPKGESTTGILGFGCVGGAAGQGGGEEEQEQPIGEQNDDGILYQLGCGDFALCNENCEIGGKKVGAEPKEEDPTSPTTPSSSSSSSSPSPSSSLFFAGAWWWRMSWNDHSSSMLLSGLLPVAFFGSGVVFF